MLVRALSGSSGGGYTQAEFFKGTWSGRNNLTVSGLSFKPKAFYFNIDGTSNYTSNTKDNAPSDTDYYWYNVPTFSGTPAATSTSKLTINSDGFTLSEVYSTNTATVTGMAFA